VVGEGALVTDDCRYAVGEAFPATGGTFAAWIRPRWAGDDPAGRTLMCIYGTEDQPDSWQRDRWSIVTGGGLLSFFIFPSEGGASRQIQASIAEWQPGEWRHVAAIWSWVGSPTDAEMRLYVDGRLAAEATKLDLQAGQPGSVLDIGRDSDASPDYAEAVFDEVFSYARPLSGEEIASAVERVRSGDVPRAGRRSVGGRHMEGWAQPDLPFRALIETLPRDQDRVDAWFEASLGLGLDLGQLGLPGAADPGSFHLVDLAAGGREVPCGVRGDRLEFAAPGPTAAGVTRRFDLYFDAAAYEPVAPLLVAVPEALPASPLAGVAQNDYAAVTYGDAWDFDEGDTEAIDRFGDKPEYCRDVRVEEGVLRASVTQDPYLIWGSMWGPEDQGERRVRIVVEDYNVLEMRVRQSVGAAQWVIYGRVAGSEQLQVHRFPVIGTGWQTVRVRLIEDARWGGTLSAFRIDPTEEVEAEIAIDWVRLASSLPATRRAVEVLGDPTGVAASVAVQVDDPHPIAGAEQTATVEVRDADGAPVTGQPVRVELAPGSGGHLAVRAQPALALSGRGMRGLTDESGRLTVTYVADTRAREGADALIATTEFPSVTSAPVSVSTRPGPARRFRVLSDGVTIIREEDLPLVVAAEPVDEHGNPTEGPAATSWQVADGRVEPLPPGDGDGRIARGVLYPDMAKRWVYTVRALAPKQLSGESGPICVLPNGPRPNPVTVGDNGYFRTADGLPYVPLGGFYINWVGLPDPATGEMGRVIRSFTDVTEEQTREWLAYLQSQGVTTLRFMLRTHTQGGLEPMDLGGRMNRPLFARALRLMDLARPFGIRFLLVVHDDYDKPVYCNAATLERFALPQFAGEDLDALPPHQRRFIRDRKLLKLPSEKYADPAAIRCQDDYARELIGALRGNPQVFGDELENEMVDCPREWAAHAVRVIREADPEAPICASHGGGGLHTADPLWWTTETPIDFYTYHLYPIGSTDAQTDYGAAVLGLAKYGTMAGTCFLGESSGDEFSDYPVERTDDRRYLMRDIIWMSLIAGNPGCFFWNARGDEIEQFRLASEIMGRIDWTRWRRAPAEVALTTAHLLADDKYYRTPDGTRDRTNLGRYCQEFLSRGLDFDLARQPSGYGHTVAVAEYAPPEPAQQPFRVSPGFQLASLTREGRTEGLLYLRNFAGVHEWAVPGRGSMWLREREPTPLSLRLNLGRGERDLTWWDLDTGESGSRTVAADAFLDLGETDHDFAVHWRRR
jgi:hypothetical protein